MPLRVQDRGKDGASYIGLHDEQRAQLVRPVGGRSPEDVLVQSDTLPADPQAELRELIRVGLDGALRAGEDRATPEAEVRALLRLACVTARAREARVEQLLILLKEAWRSVPPSRERSHAEEQARFSRVVTLCIREYYGAPARAR